MLAPLEGEEVIEALLSLSRGTTSETLLSPPVQGGTFGDTAGNPVLRALHVHEKRQKERARARRPGREGIHNYTFYIFYLFCCPHTFLCFCNPETWFSFFVELLCPRNTEVGKAVNAKHCFLMGYLKEDESSEISHLGNSTKRWLIEVSRTRKEYRLGLVEPSRLCGERRCC